MKNLCQFFINVQYLPEDFFVVVLQHCHMMCKLRNVTVTWTLQSGQLGHSGQHAPPYVIVAQGSAYVLAMLQMAQKVIPA